MESANTVHCSIITATLTPMEPCPRLSTSLIPPRLLLLYRLSGAATDVHLFSDNIPKTATHVRARTHKQTHSNTDTRHTPTEALQFASKAVTQTRNYSPLVHLCTAILQDTSKSVQRTSNKTLFPSYTQLTVACLNDTSLTIVCQPPFPYLPPNLLDFKHAKCLPSKPDRPEPQSCTVAQHSVQIQIRV